jgi:hypothetical protein
MVLNELAQWSVLLILVVFVLGLTRQLGHFLTPRAAQRGLDYGPAVGDKLPEVLLSASERHEIASLTASAGTRAAALIVVHERCDPCEVWLDALARSDGVDVPLVMMAGNASPKYVARLARFADLVVADDGAAERLRDTNLTATPFLLLVDGRLRIRHKQLGGELRAGLHSWPPEGAGGNGTASRNGAGELRVETVTPERSGS